jgi:DNA-directed RNA polymerase specialized sigma24 family protein
VLLANPGDHPTELMDLRGARFALIEETPEARKLDVQRMKKITGTAEITARRIAQNPVTFTATHSLFVTSNHRPMVDQTDGGTWRRLALVRFPFTFRGQSADPGLRDRIKRNMNVRRAVLAWIVEGAMRPNRNSAVDHERHAMTSTRPLARIWPKSPHIDEGLLRWMASDDLDPDGDPAWHDEALRALADAAHRQRWRIEAQEGAQEALLYLHLHRDKFRAWSAANSSPGLVYKASHDAITDAVRRLEGDHKVTIAGRRQRVFAKPTIPLSALAAADEDGNLETFDQTMDWILRKRADQSWSDLPDWANMALPDQWIPHVVEFDGEWQELPHEALMSKRELQRLALPLLSRALASDQWIALQSVSALDRRLLLGHYGEDADFGALARNAGLSRPTLERRLRRARAQIQKKFTTISEARPDSAVNGPIGSLGAIERGDQEMYTFAQGARLAGVDKRIASRAALVLRYAGHPVTEDGVMDDRDVAVLWANAWRAMAAFDAATKAPRATTGRKVARHAAAGFVVADPDAALEAAAA